MTGPTPGGHHLLCASGAYGPYVLSGGFHRSQAAAATRQCGSAFHLCLVEDGTAVLRRPTGAVQTITGPMGLFLDPALEATITVSPRSTWSWLAFDPMHAAAPWRQQGPGKYHLPGVSHPSSEEIWACSPPMLVPVSRLASLRVTMRQICATWWQSDLLLARSGHLLGLWIHDLVSTATTDAVGRHQLERVERIILNTMALGLSSRAIAEQVGVSVKTLNRLVRNHTGRTTRAWSSRLRLREAARLLHASEEAIEAIAKRCGWSSRPSFVRAFLAEMGQAPSAWRRSHHAQGGPFGIHDT